MQGRFSFFLFAVTALVGCDPSSSPRLVPKPVPLTARPAPSLPVRASGHAAPVEGLPKSEPGLVGFGFRADGGLVVVAHRGLLVLDVGKLRMVGRADGTAPTGAPVFADNGTRALVPTETGVDVWDLGALRAVSLKVSPVEDRAWALSPDGASVATLVCQKGPPSSCAVEVFGASDGARRARFPVASKLGVEGEEVSPGELAFSPKGTSVVVTKVWAHVQEHRAIHSLPDGKQVFADSDIRPYPPFSSVVRYLDESSVVLSRHDGVTRVALPSGRARSERWGNIERSLRHTSGVGERALVGYDSAHRLAFALGASGPVSVSAANGPGSCAVGCWLAPFEGPVWSLVGGEHDVRLDFARGVAERVDGPPVELAEVLVDGAAPERRATLETRGESCVLRVDGRPHTLPPSTCSDRAGLRGDVLVTLGAAGLEVRDLVRDEVRAVISDAKVP